MNDNKRTNWPRGKVRGVVGDSLCLTLSKEGSSQKMEDSSDR